MSVIKPAIKGKKLTQKTMIESLGKVLKNFGNQAGKWLSIL